MEELTEVDRGTFFVETQGSLHKWEISDDEVLVTRFSSRSNPYGCDSLNARPYRATVKVWPAVGAYFLNVINGGASDVPWTRSSRIKSIRKAD